MPQTAIFGFRNIYSDDTLLKNHILLLFKFYVYNGSKHENISLNNLLRNVRKFKDIEKEIPGNNEKRSYCITKSVKQLKIIETTLNVQN